MPEGLALEATDSGTYRIVPNLRPNLRHQHANTRFFLLFSAYVLGLVATYISLYLMESAQPALLYLVPFTLTPVILVAWIRGDLPAMWQGDFPSQQVRQLHCSLVLWIVFKCF